MKIIIIGTLPSSIENFRGKLIREFLNRDHKVIAMSTGASNSELTRFKEMGINYIDYPIERSGLNPFKDLRAFARILKTFKKEEPDLILAYTVKPIIWGGISAQLLKLKGFNALVTGLGYAFESDSIARSSLKKLVQALYKYSLRNAQNVIFQNPDNMDTFIKKNISNKKQSYVVNGSGVNLTLYEVYPVPASPKFLLIARLLKDKGIREYIEAAKIVKAQFPEIIFELVGPEDPSPNGIPLGEIMLWHNQGIISYKGPTNDVRPFIKNCSVYVLPSYHEGMPRTVLEAMAMGRPIITTLVPGCRETVINEVNGFLVPKKDIKSLANKIIWFIENAENITDMGNESRKMAENKYDVDKVNANILEILNLTDTL